MKDLKNKKAITLIVLIITIAIMLILVAVTASVTLGENGLITKTRKESFYQEMIDLKEKKKVSNKYSIIENADEVFVGEDIEEEERKNLEEVFLDRQLTKGELQNLDKTLKGEIIYIREKFGEKERLKTTQIWNYDMYGAKTTFTNDTDLEDLAQDIYYIKKEQTNKKEEKAYIYDKKSDVCFKVDKTKLGGWIVHSLEYAKFVVDGEKAIGEGVIETEVGTLKTLNGALCYEPDLNNFSYETEVIYYSEDLKEEYPVSIKEFIENGKQNTITGDDGKTYTFANYTSVLEGGNPIWANVRTKANGLVSYWVWIPRYAYKVDTENSKVEVIFVNIEDDPMDKELYGETLPTGYELHEAFTQKDGLKGIWFSKFEPTAVETVPLDQTEPLPPNLSEFSYENTSAVYYNASASKYEERSLSTFEKDANGVPIVPQTIEVEKDGETETYYWYNYPNKMWANVKTEANELEAWWVWIPRFAFKVESGTLNVIFVNEQDKPLDSTTYGESLPAGYEVHEAFSQNNGLSGIWFSKFEPTEIKPEVVEEEEDTTNE